MVFIRSGKNLVRTRDLRNDIVGREVEWDMVEQVENPLKFRLRNCKKSDEKREQIKDVING